MATEGLIRDWFFHIHYAGRSLVTMRRGVSLLKLYDGVRARHPGAKIACITKREYSELVAKAMEPVKPGRVRRYEIDQGDAPALQVVRGACVDARGKRVRDLAD